MELQKIFRSSYASQLRDDVKQNIGIERWHGESFPFDESKLLVMSDVNHPDGLLEKMDARNDMESAIALYEAYPNLTPFIATYAPFWESLAHMDLFEYVRNRWPKAKESESKYVLDHWFLSSGVGRHALANLWWTVRMSLQEEESNPYELTRVYFNISAEIRTRRLLVSSLGRNRNSTIGILKFYRDYKELLFDNAGTYKLMYIMKYFNMLGGVKMLCYLPSSFFYNELEKIIDRIDIVKGRSDVQGRDDLFADLEI
ncbi:MAG: hypothetical protein J5486_02225 [Bacteroidaceae bacterium]|nr:hypothetical protein [Bacteroidaceae bacterium]